MPGGFAQNTRQHVIVLPTQTKPSGGGSTTTVPLPTSGILSAMYLEISVTVSGTLSAQNGDGFSAAIGRVRVTNNSNTDIINLTCAGYHWALKYFIDSYAPFVGAGGRTAVTATTADISMWLPIAVNIRDPLGLLLLSSRETTYNLNIDWATDTTLATGATVSATCIPHLIVFDVPTNKQDYPDFTYLHIIAEEQDTVGSAMDFVKDVQRGGEYLQLFHRFGTGVSPADNWSRAILRTNQVFNIYDLRPHFLDAVHLGLHNGVARNLGLIFYDLVGSSGLHGYGNFRDPLDSKKLTDFQSIVTTTTSGTLYTLRRMIVKAAG